MNKKTTGNIGFSGTFVTRLPAGIAINNFQPLGALLGQKAINRLEFCKDFIAKTKEFENGSELSVKITVKSKKFNIKILGPVVTSLIKKTLNIEKGGSNVKNNIAELTEEQVLEIAKVKFKFVDNIHTIEDMCKCIKSTAKSMGIGIKK